MCVCVLCGGSCSGQTNRWTLPARQEVALGSLPRRLRDLLFYGRRREGDEVRKTARESVLRHSQASSLLSLQLVLPRI